MNLKLFVFIFTLLSFFYCKHSPHTVTKITEKQLIISNNLASDSIIEDFIKPYREHICKQRVL